MATRVCLCVPAGGLVAFCMSFLHESYIFESMAPVCLCVPVGVSLCARLSAHKRAGVVCVHVCACVVCVVCCVCVRVHIDYELLRSFIVLMLAAPVPLKS